ncbi:MAG: hypothetical protein DRP88_07725 [Candidatus Neomarinimicrobiota bacterium]|nr:MAG: hypothetical protein DRP88_07725 [Candidatus Neomarinimicrobiota bacterium]
MKATGREHRASKVLRPQPEELYPEATAGYIFDEGGGPSIEGGNSHQSPRTVGKAMKAGCRALPIQLGPGKPKGTRGKP